MARRRPKLGGAACLLGIPCKEVEGGRVEEPEAHWGKGLSFWEQRFLGAQPSPLGFLIYGLFTLAPAP